MNLYGDWANAAVLSLELERRGLDAVVDNKSVGDEIDLRLYDIIYIGAGTERSQRACMRDMSRYAGRLIERIEAGMHVLATGNSHELFGGAVTEARGDRYETLGLLDFETKQQDSRVTGDCVYRTELIKDKLIGFVNRAGHGQEGNIERPFVCEMGPGAGDEIHLEGIIYKNLLGTYLTGPILVRNPPLMRYIADLIVGKDDSVESAATEECGLESEPGDNPFFHYQEAAYKLALRELSARIGTGK